MAGNHGISILGINFVDISYSALATSGVVVGARVGLKLMANHCTYHMSYFILMC